MNWPPYVKESKNILQVICFRDPRFDGQWCFAHFMYVFIRVGARTPSRWRSSHFEVSLHGIRCFEQERLNLANWAGGWSEGLHENRQIWEMGQTLKMGEGVWFGRAKMGANPCFLTISDAPRDESGGERGKLRGYVATLAWRNLSERSVALMCACKTRHLLPSAGRGCDATGALVWEVGRQVTSAKWIVMMEIMREMSCGFHCAVANEQVINTFRLLVFFNVL